MAFGVAAFMPPSIFVAGRKASLLRRHLEEARRPIPRETAYETVARAWGWIDWAEFRAAVDAGGKRSAYDEDLVGPTARSGAMDGANQLVVALRNERAAKAVAFVFGLPRGMGMSLAAAVRFCGDPDAPLPAPPDPIHGNGAGRCLYDEDLRASKGVWLSPDEFRDTYKAYTDPPAPEFAALVEAFRERYSKPPLYPLWQK